MASVAVGKKVPAFLYRPAAGGPSPAIIDVHGGPTAQSKRAFSAFRQYAVSKGYTVLVPNVRGSDGYGKTYLSLDNGPKREDSVKDIGALLDWIAQQPELDANRIGVSGGSYGGYMVLAALTHYSSRIRAGIDLVGISNFNTFLNNTESYRRDLRRAEYGDERDADMRSFLQGISPVTNAAAIKRPLLIVQGMNDPRVPASESEQMMARVRAAGGEVWYLAAKDEGHSFRRKSNRDAYLQTVAQFLRRLNSK